MIKLYLEGEILTESDVIRILNKHCGEQKMKFFAHIYRGSKGYILDGFAITQAYRSMKTIGYEIKVSRGDFLQDKKWQNYLPVCNTFYFVSPPEVIYKEDLPDGIGLYHVIDNKLKCVKRAKKQAYDKEAVFEVFQYIALSRTSSERQKIKSAVNEKNRAIREANTAKSEAKIYRQRFRELQEEYYELKYPERRRTN